MTTERIGAFRGTPFRAKAERAQLVAGALLTDPSTPREARERYIRHNLHAVACPECRTHWTLDAPMGWLRKAFVYCGCAT